MLRFKAWAKQMRLTDDDDPLRFEERYRMEPLKYSVTLRVLSYLCGLLTEHHGLEKKYELESLRTSQPRSIQEAHVQATSSDLDDYELPNIGLPTSLRILVATVSFEQILPEFRRRISGMKKFRWVVKDNAKFHELLTQIKSLNDSLVTLLPDGSQRTLDRSLNIDLPGEVLPLSRLSKAASISPDYIDYAAAAMIKSINLRHLQNFSSGKGTPDAKGVTVKTLHDLQLDKDLISYPDADLYRCLGVHRTKATESKVLIEFKTLEKPFDEDTLAVWHSRLQLLLLLLMATPKPGGYRVLDCKGFFEAHSKIQQRYGIVFEFPAFVTKMSDPSFYTLRDLLRGNTDNKPPAEILLGDRFRLASLLANSISYLHSAGWLHHNLESSNVICFADNAERSIRCPYIAGFGYARIDDPREISEVDSGRSSNLYRHPDYQTPSSTSKGNRYRRSYDIYSLGVILIEIGLWKQIDTFWRSGFERYSFAEHLRQKVAPLLGHYMGDNYRDATLLCLDSSQLNIGDDEGTALSNAFSNRVVQVLENCHA